MKPASLHSDPNRLGALEMASYQHRLAEALAEQFTQDGRCDPAVAPTVADMVASRVQLDAAGRPVVPVLDIISAVKAEMPELFSTLKPVESSTPSRPRSRLDIDMDATRKAAEAERVARHRAVREAGNPWMKGAGFNITRQSVLRNIDPALADRLMREAGL